MNLKNDKIISRRGVTLLEVMVVLFIVLIISAAIFSIFFIGRKTWFLGSTQVTVQQEARKAIDWMVQELTFSSAAQVTIGGLGDTVTFSKPQNVDAAGSIIWSTSIQYSLSNGQILKTIGGSPNRILAHEVKALQFTALGSDGIEIKVTTQKDTVDKRDIEYVLTSQIYYRN